MLENNFVRPIRGGAKETSRTNIEKKIEILETWLRDGVPWEYSHGNLCRDDRGNRSCIYVPDSLRSFNKWSGENYSDETKKRLNCISISGNGTDTLNNYPRLKERAVALLKDITQLVQTQQEFEPHNRVSGLDAEIKRLNIFIENQSRKILEFQRENIDLARRVSKIEHREKGNIEELRKNYADLDDQNYRLREEISLLTKQLKNIHSLKDVKSEK